MTKESSLQLARIKSKFTTLPLPKTFSRLVAVLLNHTNRDTLECWPSIPRLAKQVGCANYTISRNLRALEALKLFSSQNLGASEARRKIGEQIKIGTKHRYKVYRLHPDHPLWKGDDQEVEQAVTTIKKYTWKGVGDRSTESAINHAAVMVEQSREGDGSGVSDTSRTNTGPCMSDNHGTVSETLSVDIPTTAVVAKSTERMAEASSDKSSDSPSMIHSANAAVSSSRCERTESLTTTRNEIQYFKAISQHQIVEKSEANRFFKQVIDPATLSIDEVVQILDVFEDLLTDQDIDCYPCRRMSSSVKNRRDLALQLKTAIGTQPTFTFKALFWALTMMRDLKEFCWATILSGIAWEQFRHQLHRYIKKEVEFAKMLAQVPKEERWWEQGE